MYATFKLQSRWIKSPTVQHTAGAQTTAAQPSLWNYAAFFVCLFLFVLKKVWLYMVPGWVWMTGNPDWPHSVTHSDLSQTITNYIGGHITGGFFSPLPQTYSAILMLQLYSHQHFLTETSTCKNPGLWSIVYSHWGHRELYRADGGFNLLHLELYFIMSLSCLKLNLGPDFPWNNTGICGI